MLVPRILLVRHGESTWNAEGRWQGHADPPLTHRGRHQATAAGIHAPRAVAVAASDLHRARVTAELLMGGRDVSVTVDTDLRERDAGAFSGLTRAEIHERFPGHLADDPTRRPDDDDLVPPPGWEHDDDLVVRAWRALDRLAEVVRHAAGDRAPIGLAVTHSGLIYAVERDLGLQAGRIANLEGRWVERTPVGWSGGERHLLLDPGHDVVTRPTSL